MYLRKIDTGECFAYSEHLAARKDMQPWHGPLPWEKETPVAARQAIVVSTAGPDPVLPTTTEVVPPKTEEPPADKPVEFKCEVCGFVAKTRAGLTGHMIKKHPK